MDKNTLIPVARDAAAGDPRALARLLDELEPLVVRTTRLIVGPGSVSAEDAAQEALIDMARGITRLRDPEAVVSWAARIATRRALRTARWERLRRNREQEIVCPQPNDPHFSSWLLLGCGLRLAGDSDSRLAFVR